MTHLVESYHLDEHPTPPDYYEQGIKRHRVQRYWHRKRFEVVERLIGETSTVLLDIGCNGGLFTSRITRHTNKALVVGIDVDRGSVLHARECYSLPTMVADGGYLPFKNETFDLITCLEVLEHVVQPSRILEEGFRCLKKGGHFIVLVPNNTLLFRVMWFFWTATWGKTWSGKHVCSFNPKSLQSLLASNGMKVVDVATFHLGMLTAVKAVKE